MSEVIFQSLIFWLYLGGIALFVSYQFFFTDKYHWLEAVAQVVISFLVIWIFSLILYKGTNDINDKEVWTDQVVSLRYYEQWEERVSCRHPIYCTRTVSHYHPGSKGRPGHTTYSTERYVCGHHHPYDVDYHPPKWVGVSESGNEHTILKGRWESAASKWGKVFVDIKRSSQHSRGDGNMYAVKPKEYIPFSTFHEYDNWVKGSKITIMRRRALNDSIKLAYPEIITGYWNNPKLNRVLQYKYTGKLAGWQIRRIEYLMDSVSARVSKRYQVNPILIITDAGSPKSLISSISEAWLGAKKNDSVLLLGLEGTKIKWAQTISWTHEASYIGRLKRLAGEDVMNVPAMWGGFIQDHWVRFPMKEFNYLKYEIELEWYWQILIGIIAFGCNAIAYYAFSRNDLNRGNEL